ncbi:hypothetical protein H5410_026566 [Solanum commersonii]|uniref:DUF4283 domain-containing protein n=1 Tax=Solanum commersonii TaxID=4109 RepID=A0A9J5YXE2_SOLCO|nr:hypothetical protein H5410_026566 [Solanum commersonii]
MIWLIQRLKEASLVKGNSVRMWKRREIFSETYCARNFNKSVLYINIINLKGRRRSVLIIPEITFNSGWMFIAAKVERFINFHRNEKVPTEPRLTDKNIPYADALRSSKWSNRGESSFNAEVTLKGGVVCINDGPNKQNEVLSRSLVGNFKDVDTPSLSEIRRWSSSMWKQIFGLNIYEMGNKIFLFEFSSKAAAEQVMNGDWLWKQMHIRFQWWSPTVGAIELQGHWRFLWRLDRNRGETQLRNHLKWARIKILGDGTSIPKEVTIESGGFFFTTQIWAEVLVRFHVGEGEEEGVQVLDQHILRENTKGKETAHNSPSLKKLVLPARVPLREELF